jgi:hypothetical protein
MKPFLSHASIVCSRLLAEFGFGSDLWVDGYAIYFVQMNQFCFFNYLAI